MESLTLYRKYRPQTFSDVVGQNHITKTLANEILSGKVGNAYLFCGTRGTGKTSIAKIFSRAVNCIALRDNGDPCNECSACIGLINGTIMDVSEIDAASNNGVEHVRALRNEVVYAPSAVKYRVYIIDEVHMMSTAAFNALLKTLEEPPSHAVFVLATTEAHKVPLTVQSRCQRFDFRRISVADIAGNLMRIAEQENFTLEQTAAEMLATLADGAMRDALSNLEQCKNAEDNVTLEVVQQILGVASSEKYFDLTEAISKNDTATALITTNEILGKSGDASLFLTGLLAHFRDLATAKALDNPAAILELPSEVIAKLKKQADELDSNFIINCMQKICEILAIGKSAGMTKTLAESNIIIMCGGLVK